MYGKEFAEPYAIFRRIEYGFFADIIIIVPHLTERQLGYDHVISTALNYFLIDSFVRLIFYRAKRGIHCGGNVMIKAAEDMINY